MNKIFLNYLLKNFLKTFLIFVLVFYCFGVILNLFEEIEFFKNLESSIFIPLILTNLYIPSMMINLLPFIIFISSMKFIIDLRNNKDLLTMKIFGFSNFKIFFVLAIILDIVFFCVFHISQQFFWFSYILVFSSLKKVCFIIFY